MTDGAGRWMPRIGARWPQPPLAVQILALLLGGLVVAQLVTLLLTVILPPAPKEQYGLDDIAAALRASHADDRLERRLQPGPPDVSGGGWLVSERSRHELAMLLEARDDQVSLAFYTPLPFAGTTTPRPMALLANDGPSVPLSGDMIGARAIRPVALLLQPPGGGPPPPGPRPELPPSAAMPRGSFPPGTLPGGGAFPGERPRRDADRPAREGRAFEIAPPAAGSGGGGGGRLYAINPRPVTPGTGGIVIPGDGGAAVPPILGGTGGVGTVANPATAAREAIPPAAVLPPRALSAEPGGPYDGGPYQSGPGIGGPGFGALVPRQVLPDRTLMTLPSVGTRAAAPLLATPFPFTPATPEVVHAPAPRLAPQPAPAPVQIPFALPPAAAEAPASAPPGEATPLQPYGPPIPITPAARGLFGFAPAPFVEGDFVAALRQADGRWAVVQPAAEPFPSAWQRRVLLWFAIAFAIVAPVGWLFARRLVKPLQHFATAAEALGRDPSAAILPLDGPAEIGRAAHAFNLMRSRLRSFVDDRTAMVGAISHDLRTPLTRMRFRIEDTEGEVREGLLEEVDAMEAMITEVIAFIRDASVPGIRERLDLGTLVEDVIEDAQMIGKDVTLAHAEAAPVEVDVLGIRRVLDNLLENAIKYGNRARVRLTAEADSIVAEIHDDGPGLPQDEIERAFEPFYRGESARASDKSGSGLGLAVCRSIARAHGGDVRLLHSDDGFVAEMRLPRAYGGERQLAA